MVALVPRSHNKFRFEFALNGFAMTGACAFDSAKSKIRKDAFTHRATRNYGARFSAPGEHPECLRGTYSDLRQPPVSCHSARRKEGVGQQCSQKFSFQGRASISLVHAVRACLCNPNIRSATWFGSDCVLSFRSGAPSCMSASITRWAT